MTPTTPSPISDQAAGEPIFSARRVEEIALLYSEWTTQLGEAISIKNVHPFVAEIRKALHAALTTGSAPVAEGWQLTETKNLDALIIAMERGQNKGYLPDSIKEAWGEFMCNPARVVAPASPAASVLTDVQILEAFEASGVQWQSVRTLANDHEYMTYGSQPAKNIIAGVRALLAASIGGEKA